MTLPRCTQPPAGGAATAAVRHRSSVPVLETERLRLRVPSLDDLPAWTHIAATWPVGPMDAETAWHDFSQYMCCWMLHGHGLWAVELHDGTLVGFVGIGSKWEDPEPELGWMMLPEHRGLGYATEAARAAAAFGADLLPTFVSYIVEENIPSQRVATKLGAQRDAAIEAQLLADYGWKTQVWRHGGTA